MGGKRAWKRMNGTSKLQDFGRPSICVIGVPENGGGVGRRIEILFEDVMADFLKFR